MVLPGLRLTLDFANSTKPMGIALPTCGFHPLGKRGTSQMALPPTPALVPVAWERRIILAMAEDAIREDRHGIPPIHLLGIAVRIQAAARSSRLCSSSRITTSLERDLAMGVNGTM